MTIVKPMYFPTRREERIVLKRTRTTKQRCRGIHGKDYILTGLIGHPIAHSLSPRIHRYWMEHHAIIGRYEALDILPENLNRDALKDYTGLNVTIPHKVAIMSLCDTLSPEATNIGAVNTLHIRGDQVHGHNTDAFGFWEALKAAHPTFDVARKPALVLGAGGAARAVVYALKNLGCPAIYVASRKKYSIAGAIAIAWEDKIEALKDIGLLVNTTSLGMVGKDPLFMPLEKLPRTAIVNDIVYTPRRTALLAEATERGYKTVEGLGMLLHQARASFALWHGVMPTVTQELEHLCVAE